MEANDMKAMREALELMTDLFDKGVICTSYSNTPEEMEQIEELYQKAKAALSAPPRNCDVGSVQEQERRFNEFCASHWSINNVDSECAGCPLTIEGAECEFAWAQTPYEKGATK